MREKQTCVDRKTHMIINLRATTAMLGHPALLSEGTTDPQQD